MDKSLVSNHTVHRLSYLIKASDQRRNEKHIDRSKSQLFSSSIAKSAKAHSDVIKLVVLSNQRNRKHIFFLRKI